MFVKQFYRSVIDGGEKSTLYAGLTGVLVAFGCVIWIWFNGGSKIAPNGDIMRPLKQHLVLGFYVITLAHVITLTNLSQRWKKWYRYMTFFYTYGAYLCEVIAAANGLNPRFSKTELFNPLIATIFTIIPLVVLFQTLHLAFHSLKMSEKGERPTFVLALRYCAIALVISFSIGIAMALLYNHKIAPDGTLLIPHAWGLNSLHFLMLFSFLLDRFPDKGPAKRLMHILGGSWVLLELTLLLHNAQGHAVLRMTALNAFNLVIFLFIGLVMLYIIRQVLFLKNSKAKTPTRFAS
jgi:hypothetical protein